MSQTLSAHQCLKQATSKLHQQVENLSLMQGLMSDQVNHTTYRTLLTRLWRLHRLLEPRIQDQLQQLAPADAAQMWRASLLRQDLQALEFSFAEPSPEQESTDYIDSPAAALGALYVLQGSMLGGKLIARHLKSHLNVAHALSFFSAGEALQAGSWKAFISHLDSNLADDKLVDMASASACQTFELFDRILGEA